MMNNTLEKTVYMTQLYDYYKEQLTQKQQTYFELYFVEDYTLQEMADEYGISRAAVLDSLNSAVKTLNNLEQTLRVVKLNTNLRNYIADYKAGNISAHDLVIKIEKDLM